MISLDAQFYQGTSKFPVIYVLMLYILSQNTFNDRADGVGEPCLGSWTIQ